MSNQDDQSQRRRFADQVIEALRREGETRPIGYDADTFSLLVGDRAGDKVSANLVNVYRDWSRAAPRARAGTVERYARAIRDTQRPRESTAVRLQNLLPLVRERFTVHGVRDPRDVRSRLRSATLAADWVVLVAEDRPDAIMTLPEDALDALGAPFEALLERALTNFHEANAGWLPHGVDGLWVAATNDSYDASRVLLGERWRAAGLSGRVVAMAPDRDMLMMASASDRHALKVMAMMCAQRLHEGHRMLSGVPITRDLDDRADTWATFNPPALLADDFRRVARLFEAAKYQEQFAMLESMDPSAPDYARAVQRIDVHAGGTRTDEIESVAAWDGRVPALMPRADKVMFACDAGMYVADWTALMARLAAGAVPTEHFPERWRVERAPTREDVAATAAVRIENPHRTH